MEPGFLLAPICERHEIAKAVEESIEIFREERFEEPLSLYADLFESACAAVTDLLELTVDLIRCRAERDRVVANADYLDALRFCASPFVSTDDLEVIADTTLTRKAFAEDSGAAARVVDCALRGLDSNRFPWVSEGREADEDERKIAVVATATLIATEKVKTLRRNEAKKAQEKAVAVALEAKGFSSVRPPKSIKTLQDAPGPGQFCREVVFGGRKADIIVGLWDRRRLALECKVSNSGTNSVKRVNNDAAVKATTWAKKFGDDQVVSAAVLSGVYTVGQLQNAQNSGLTLFWAHRLDDMVEWIGRTRG